MNILVKLKTAYVDGYQQTNVNGFEIGNISLNGFNKLISNDQFTNLDKWYTNIWLWVIIAGSIIILILLIILITYIVKKNKLKEEEQKLKFNSLNSAILPHSVKAIGEPIPNDDVQRLHKIVDNSRNNNRDFINKMNSKNKK